MPDVIIISLYVMGFLMSVRALGTMPNFNALPMWMRAVVFAGWFLVPMVAVLWALLTTLLPPSTSRR